LRHTQRETERERARAQEKTRERWVEGKWSFAVLFPSIVKEDHASELEAMTAAERKEVEGEKSIMVMHAVNCCYPFSSLGFGRIGLSRWFSFTLDHLPPPPPQGHESCQSRD
jgi:hypothetical protein